jgi:hypothetical protein
MNKNSRNYILTSAITPKQPKLRKNVFWGSNFENFPCMGKLQLKVDRGLSHITNAYIAIMKQCNSRSLKKLLGRFLLKILSGENISIKHAWIVNQWNTCLFLSWSRLSYANVLQIFSICMAKLPNRSQNLVFIAQQIINYSRRRVADCDL